MSKCDHHIGLWYEFGMAYRVTLEQLKEYEKEGSEYGDWTMEDYLNKDKETNFAHFDFCPKCGEKIDWDKIKEYELQRMDR
jgi:hypothetical protein